MKAVEYVIIGAGLTGLVTAYELQKRGHSVLIIEKEKRCGGFIESVEADGFLYERGPNSGVFSNPHVVELLEELDEKLQLEIASEKVKNRFILKEGRWEKLPLSPIELLNTKLFSTADKLKLLLEPFVRRTNKTETLEELISRRFGDSILHYAVDPFIGGIYAGDPAKLVPKYALPKMYALEKEHGSFIGGALAKAFTKKSARDKKANRKIYSFKGGLEKLVTALVDSIGSEFISLDAQYTTVKKVADYFVTNFEVDGKIQSIESKKVISTIRGDDLESIFPVVEKSDAEKLKSIEYAPVVEVTLGFKKWYGMALNGFGGLIPFVENRRVLGILFLSSCFENRAPKDGALLTAFVGGVRRAALCELSDEEIITLLKEELTDLLHMTEFSPDLIEIGRHIRGIPQYDRHHGERLLAIKEIEQSNKGLYILGNIRDGIGMADRIQQARQFVASVTDNKDRQ